MHRRFAAASMPLRPIVSAFAVVLCAAAHAASPRLATIAIPGDPRFVALARDVAAIQSDYVPDFAAQSGLIDDAIHVPSFAPEHVDLLTRRVRADMQALRALPWRDWSVDRQIDVRWVEANAERIDRELSVERVYRHRPGAWLEPLANTLVVIVTYAPARTDAIDGLAAQVPALVAEMQSLCRPSGVDAGVAAEMIDGIVTVLKADAGTHRDAAVAALVAYRARLAAIRDKDPAGFEVIGADDYAWRLRHAELLPWTPAQLLAQARRELERADDALATLAPHLPEPAPLSPALEQQARTLDQAGLLALYDRIQLDLRAAIERAGFVTIPPGVGRVRARVTPDALVPLDGDGGSMIPPPPFLAETTSWWNVEHFDPKMSLADRENRIRSAVLWRSDDMAPYAAHEGMPGHHLQLSLARLNPDAIRSLFVDGVQVEGWGLYAEQEMWEQGGLGNAVDTHASVLHSWRGRVRRVIFDVQMETGAWTLQQGADWRAGQSAGAAPLTPEILRAINWPTQLVSYFAGRAQILDLKHDAKAAWGTAYSERRFNDELLALGSIPIVFARAKLLGEPVPDFDPPG